MKCLCGPHPKKEDTKIAKPIIYLLPPNTRTGVFMPPLIVPAVIASTPDELATALEKLKGIAKRVQLDVMDGKFVSNTSLMFEFEIPEHFEYEAHLMIEDPLKWIDMKSSKVDAAILQVETLTDIGGSIRYVKAKGLDVMLALNPETPVEKILPYLEMIDGVLILTVEPGSYCVEFYPEHLEKARVIRSKTKKLPIEVDGCMSPEHVRMAKKAGASVFASGSYIIKSPDPASAIKELEDALND